MEAVTELTRRRFVSLLYGAAVVVLAGFSQCNGESDALKNLRNILAAVESALKFLTGMGLANELVQVAAKYLSSVTEFVHQAAEVLEDASLSVVERAAKITSLGAGVILPHVTDQRVDSILRTVQAAVQVFLALFQPSNPANVAINDKNRRTLVQIEKDAQKDQEDVQKWAKEPHAAPVK